MEGPGIDRRARSRKARGGLRALLGRAPGAEEVGARLVRIARRMFRDALIDASPRRLTLALHPHAPPVRLAVLPDGELEVQAETSALGPGYHRHVLARLAPMLDELDLAWEGDEPDASAAMAAWFAGELARGATQIGMPAERTFRLDAGVLTALGPRDRAWCDAVLADPPRCADAFAWWDDGPGRAERASALLAMWHEVPWRAPLGAEERAMMEQVDADLRAAHRADPALALPWAAWAELLEHLGGEEERIAALRARGEEPLAPLGYRRHLMEVDLAGWILELPGAFVGGWEDDGTRYWATDGERALELTTMTATTDHTSQQLLEVAPPRHPVIAELAEDGRCGRAEAYDEGGVHVVHGLMTSAPAIAILTCKGALADQAWALATWRSLRVSGPT